MGLNGLSKTLPNQLAVLTYDSTKCTHMIKSPYIIFLISHPEQTVTLISKLAAGDTFSRFHL